MSDLCCNAKPFPLYNCNTKGWGKCGGYRITGGYGNTGGSAPTVSLPDVIQSFKRHSTIEYIKLVKQNILPPFDKQIWQRGYYEHIIRNEHEYQKIYEYIENNPIKWEEDKYYE